MLKLIKIIRASLFDTKELDIIRNHCMQIRDLFENECVVSLPRPFYERMVAGDNEIRKVWALRFRPVNPGAVNQLPDGMRMEHSSDLGFPVTRWEHLHGLLRYPMIRPCWPDFAKVREKLGAVCQAFVKENRMSFEPTDAEIQAAAVNIVRQHEPSKSVSSDKRLAARVATGDVPLASALRSDHLQALAALALKPVSVPGDAICDNLERLVQKRRLSRQEINGAFFYFTPDRNNSPWPWWNAKTFKLSLEGTVIKKFIRYPDGNQTRILAAFEEEGWPPWIDDPLPPSRSVKHLDRTIAELNKSLRDTPLSFEIDKSGERIAWELSRSATSTGD